MHPLRLNKRQGCLYPLQQEIASRAFWDSRSRSWVPSDCEPTLRDYGTWISIHHVPWNCDAFGYKRELRGFVNVLNVLPFSICERDRLDLAVNDYDDAIVISCISAYGKSLIQRLLEETSAASLSLIVFYSLVFNVLEIYSAISWRRRIYQPSQLEWT